MIIYEDYNETLVKAYSDEDFYIERDDVLYEEAIDLKELHRTYTETNTPIEIEEATIEDYENSLRKVGVEV